MHEQHEAARKISHNVAQSSTAAREVSDRIVTVADEAVNTGRQAGEVEAMLRGMTEQVGELGRVLTRTVRTSTPEVNRRSSPRHAIETPATLIDASGGHPTQLADISTGGARLQGVNGMGRVAAGHKAVLRVDELEVPSSVVQSGDDSCRLKFEPGNAAAVQRWIDRNKH